MRVPTPIANGVVWHKSSRSNGDGNVCVEIAFLPAAVALRDSKDPDAALVVSTVAWEGLHALVTRR